MPRGELNIYEIVFEELVVGETGKSDSDLSFATLVDASSPEKELPNSTTTIGRVGLMPTVGVDLVIQSNYQEKQKEYEAEPTVQVPERLQSLASEVLEIIVDTIIPNNGNLSHKTILKSLDSLGILLTEGELSEFMYLFAIHPVVIPLPDGSFNIKRLKSESKVSASENKATEAPLTAEAIGQVGRPLSRSQINKALQSINTSDEYKVYKDKRRANPRRRRSKKRTYGSNHGHKKSIDELIKEMNNREASFQKSEP